ncbi:hypothetical protein BC834DRAFT_911120, partial [Gloeopeniophorella convolvens]
SRHKHIAVTLLAPAPLATDLPKIRSLYDGIDGVHLSVLNANGHLMLWAFFAPSRHVLIRARGSTAELSEIADHAPFRQLIGALDPS